MIKWFKENEKLLARSVVGLTLFAVLAIIICIIGFLNFFKVILFILVMLIIIWGFIKAFDMGGGDSDIYPY